MKTKLTAKQARGGNGKDYVLAVLTDANGKPIPNVSIGFADDGVKYYDTDSNGKARYYPNKTKEGAYNIKVAFFGNKQYEASERIPVRFWVGKIPTQLKIVREGNYITARLTDTDGKAVPNVPIGFAYNGVTYINTTSNGVSKYNISKFGYGTFTVKVAFFGNDKYKPTDKISFKFTNEKPKPPAKKKYGHSTEPCCEDRGQNTPYYCGPHALQEVFRNLTGIVVPQGTIAGWAGTTTSGTGHWGLETAVAKFNSKYNKNLKVEWKNFSDIGWSGIKSIVNSNDKDCIIHNWYKRGTEDGGGHYEVVNAVYDDTVNVQNSLGSRCSHDCYYGYIEYRSKSTFEYYINGISQKSVMVITNA